jgi:hypothetical protein
MNLDIDRSGVSANVPVTRRQIRVSPWLNEPYPARDEYLTAHDVARLMRRPPWLLCSMAFLRGFPSKRRFRSLTIGWLKSDVVGWMHRRTHLRVTGASEALAQAHSDAGRPSS